MSLKVIREGTWAPSSLELRLVNYCLEHHLEHTIEWIDGQYWLHSDVPKERPIGINIDEELNRHQEYFKHHSIHKELLARAVGIKGAHRPKLLDLTGGLLGDSLLFLSFGLEIITLERHPVTALLIESALARAKHPAVERLSFIPLDAKSYLETHDPPEVIFFDPMFEDANLKTAPKKEMRIFRSVVGKDADAQAVFELALAKKPKRLVVKRPKHSVELGKRPDVTYEGKSTRYDVFFCSNMAEVK